MPLNKQALRLESDPRAVPAARRWIVDTLEELHRDDLLECAELGVSELVTNALLHADDPITVRVRGTARNPRIEVSDGSSEAPVLPGPSGDDLDDLLATFGRGLNIVAMCSVAWGTAIEREGKIVWFEPATEPHGDIHAGELIDQERPEHLPPGQPQAQPGSPDAPGRAAPSPGVPIHIEGVPLATMNGLRRHYRDLRRELRLLSLAHEADYPLAKDLTDLFARFERAFPADVAVQVTAAMDRGDATADIDVRIQPDAAAVLEQMLTLLDLADEFCHNQRLLSLARSPEQVRFQRWWFGEFIRQSRGEPATEWDGAPASDAGASAAS